jgi:hypothetical protein
MRTLIRRARPLLQRVIQPTPLTLIGMGLASAALHGWGMGIRPQSTGLEVAISLGTLAVGSVLAIVAVFAVCALGIEAGE